MQQSTGTLHPAGNTEPVHLESLGPGCGGCALCRGAFLHLHTHSRAEMKEISDAPL